MASLPAQLAPCPDAMFDKPLPDMLRSIEKPGKPEQSVCPEQPESRWNILCSERSRGCGAPFMKAEPAVRGRKRGPVTALRYKEENMNVKKMAVLILFTK